MSSHVSACAARACLSDAIIAGALLRPQAFGSYFSGRTRSDACSCSLGGAFEVTFPDAPLANYAVVINFDKFAAAYPILASEEQVYCPECAGEQVITFNPCNLFIHLNDEHRWTRERVAEYVRRFEQ